MKKLKALIDDGVAYKKNPEEAYIDREELQEQAKMLIDAKEAVERLKKMKTANQIYAEFAVDAARMQVMEMFTAKTSNDRLKAIDAVTNRALGKPVDRQLNMNVDISNSSTEELKSQAEGLLRELGFIKQGDLGTVNSLVIPIEAEGGGGEVKEVQAESGVSGGLREIEGEDQISIGGESIGEDPHGGG